MQIVMVKMAKWSFTYTSEFWIRFWIIVFIISWALYSTYRNVKYEIRTHALQIEQQQKWGKITFSVLSRLLNGSDWMEMRLPNALLNNMDKSKHAVRQSFFGCEYFKYDMSKNSFFLPWIVNFSYDKLLRTKNKQQKSKIQFKCRCSKIYKNAATKNWRNCLWTVEYIELRWKWLAYIKHIDIQ